MTVSGVSTRPGSGYGRNQFSRFRHTCVIIGPKTFAGERRVTGFFTGGQVDENRLRGRRPRRVAHFVSAGSREKGRRSYTAVVDDSYVEWAADRFAPEEHSDHCFDLRRDAGRDIAGAQASLSSLRICVVREAACDQQRNRPKRHL